MSYPDSAIAKAMKAMEATAPTADADPTRPIYHFRPPAGWMNDVNGPLFHKGYFHIFYQLNPYDVILKHVHWGHARSRDLVTWEHLPIALAPDVEGGEVHCASGTACFNRRDEPMIFYTRFTPDPTVEPYDQRAALGDEDLIRWKKHPTNPILSLKSHGEPDFSYKWRDPFVFEQDGRTFMIVGAAEAGTPIYEAQDKGFIEWAYRGLMSNVSAECPNFVRLGDEWMLITSPWNPVEYHIGSFDLKNLTFEPRSSGRIEDAGIFYGTNLLFDSRERCIFLGRFLGFEEGRAWNGCMALPRILSIGPDGRPRQVPLPELEILRSESCSRSDIGLSDEFRVIEEIKGDTLEILSEFEPGDAKSIGLEVRRSGDGKRAITVRYEDGKIDIAGPPGSLIFVQPGDEGGRGRKIRSSRFDFPFKRNPDEKTLKLHVFLDRSVMEVFVNDGRSVATPIIYPNEGDLGLAVFARGGTARLRSLSAWKMKSIWS